MRARDLRDATTRELRDRIVNGQPVDPSAIEGWVYRGTSLGLPSFVERLTWKTFQKAFYRDSASGRLLGWNVRLEQDGVDAPSRPKIREGIPVTEWQYEVISPAGVPMPRGFDRGLVIDYSLAPNPPGSILFVKDPLVALEPGNADELLGVSYVVAFGRAFETPTYFTLEREAPISFVPSGIAGSPGIDPLRLTATERRWAEELFAAILGVGSGGPLPAFDSIDRGAFWRAFEGATSPLVRAGLRPMVHALVFLPLVTGFGRPFFRLSPQERERFVAAAARDRRLFVRQSLTTLKMLACFAYYDDPIVRDRYDASPAPGARS